jgi:radical SAM superfamily enzyme YgiQ (UPF0313 family)
MIDAKFEQCDTAAVLDLVRAEAPAVVGFTAMTPEISDTARLAEAIRHIRPEAFIVLGGPHATALPAETLQEFAAFDAVVVNEGEETLTSLVEVLGRQADPGSVAGVVYRTQDGTIKHTAPRKPIADLDRLSYPAWDLFPRSAIYPVIASRGCPFNCNFCMRVSGTQVRRHSPEWIVAEIERLITDFEAKKIVFHDETFGLNKAWANRLIDLMIAHDFGRRLRWEAVTRVDIADYEFYRKMKRAGCSWLSFGIESGNPEILRRTGKGITLEQAEQAVRLARRAGLNTGSLFIIGHPGETRQTIDDTIRFARRLPTDTASCGLMVPYPGTEIAELVRRGEGNYRVLSADWKDFNKQVGNALEMKDISRQELERYQLKFYLFFYLITWRLNRIITLAQIIGWRGVWSGGTLVIRRFLAKLFRRQK